MKFCLFVCLVFISSLSIISCQKELGPYTPSTGTDSTDVPVDTTSNDSSSVDSYHPTTVGSTWTYKDSATGAQTVATIGDSTKVINGITFREYLSTSNSQTVSSWIASPTPKYYISAEGSSPNTGSPFNLTFYYLNDESSVGTHWDYTAGTGNGFSAYTTTTVIAKDISLSVEGKNYTNVTRTHLDLSYDLLGTVTKYAGYDYYMAKGVGFIKIQSVLYVPGLPEVKSCTNLVSYTIQ